MSSCEALIEAYPCERPLARASTIPSRWYHDRDLASLETERVFARTWQPVARAAQLTTKGQFVTTRVARERIVVIRGEAGINAFYNVCRHHAAQVVTAEHGCAKRFHCPYHGWTYDLEGRLKSAPAFEGVEDFNFADHGLVEVRVGLWRGLIFVNLDEDAPPLAKVMQDVDAIVDAMHIEDLTHQRRTVFKVPCNWKVYVDNYLDGGYHVPFLHRGLAGVLDQKNYRIETGGRHCLQTCPTADKGSPDAAVRKGDLARYLWIYPNLMLNAYEGVLDINLVVPTGPETCEVIFDYYFDPAMKDAEVESSIRVADQVQREDMDICGAVQEGLHSRSYDTGRLSVRKEAGEYLFHQLLYRDLRT